jgi:hypothetical protein
VAAANDSREEKWRLGISGGQSNPSSDLLNRTITGPSDAPAPAIACDECGKAARFVGGIANRNLCVEHWNAAFVPAPAPASPDTCATCGGEGEVVYTSTTLGRGGLGGQQMTAGRCRDCDGSGRVPADRGSSTEEVRSDGD